MSIAQVGATSLDYAETFIPVDLSVVHGFDLLLKDVLVSYRIDGVEVYSGLAYQATTSTPYFLVGDSSGSTLKGQGSMYNNISFDNSPLEDVQVSAVPVPAAAWLFA